MLFIVANILHQAQNAENERTRMEFTQTLIEQIAQLKSFTANLEERINQYAKNETKLRQEFMTKFNHDLETLAKLLHNQQKFMENFEEAKKWHTELSELLINFTEFKLPELDSIVHKHIDMLRISEAEHYEKLNRFLHETLGGKDELTKEVQTLQEQMRTLSTLKEQIASEIVQNISAALSRLSENFQKELKHLTLSAQMLQTLLKEDEKQLIDIKTHSKLVLEQMVLVSKRLESFEKQKNNIESNAQRIAPLLEQVERLQVASLQTIQTLTTTTDELKNTQQEQLEKLQNDIELFLLQIDKKFQETLPSAEHISENLKLLAKKTQINKGGYTNE